METLRFVICNKDTDNHLKNESGYRHPTRDEGVSLFITKFPSEKISMAKFIERFNEFQNGKKRYCIPDYQKFSVIFPESVTSSLSELKSEYSGTGLFNIWESIRSDSCLGVEYSSTNSAAGVAVNLVKIMNGFPEFSEHLDEIYLFADIKKDKEGNPKDGTLVGDDVLENKKLSFESEVNCFMEGLKNYTNLIVEGVAGSGKSHMLQELRESGVYGENGSRIEVVVFHPSTSYEEFVSGIRPNFMRKKGERDFVSQEGIFVDMCNRAADNSDKEFLLFIDEINRANTSRVFGDLMLVIEDSKRVDFSKFQIGLSERDGENQPGGGKGSEAKLKESKIIDLKIGDSKDSQKTENDEMHSEGFRYGALFSSKSTIPSIEDRKVDYVRLQTPIIKSGIEFNKLVVPTNLHILGTMNTTDRSVGTIDLALRRRFHWITQEPMSNKDELLTALNLSGDKDKSVGLVADWFIHANEVLGSKVGPDARLGHAYFFNKNGDAEAIAEALLNQLKEIAFTFNIDEKVLWGVSKDGKFNKDNPVYCLESKKYIGAVEVIIQKDNQEEKKQLWGVQNEGEGLGRRPVVKKIDDKGKSSMADGGNNSENEGSESATSEDEQGNQ